MTRLEEKNTQVEELQEEISNLKKGLKRKQNRKMLSCSNCLVSLIIICLLLFFLGAFLLAKSGLKDVPLFTNWFYQDPEPSYLVEYQEQPQTEIVPILEEKIRQTALAQQKPGDFAIELSLTDEQLTELLRQKINEEEKTAQKIDYAQIAVLPDSLEFFIKQKEPDKIKITLNIEPKIVEQKLDLKVTNFKIGDLTLPKFLADWSFATLAETSLNSVLSYSGEYGYIKDVKLAPESMTLFVHINKINQ